MAERGSRAWKLTGKVRREVLSLVLPDPVERARVETAASRLLERTKEAIAEERAESVVPVLAGSVAKGTYSPSPDIDLFLLFPKDTHPKELEEKGLSIGSRVLADPVKKYTQHPYLSGDFDGFSCDLVPCLRIGAGERVRTAVDRTPHHVEYINSMLIPEQREEVLLLKSFLKGIGAYGAEDTVNGFSGYLVELLTIAKGDFSSVMELLSSIGPLGSPPGRAELVNVGSMLPPAPILIGPIGNGQGSDATSIGAPVADFVRDALVVIDPVDPKRNVASPVSAQTLSLTANAARALIERASVHFFHPFSKRPWDLSPFELMTAANCPEVRSCPLPEGNSSMVITQFRSVLRTCLAHMEREGFKKASAKYLLVFPKGWPIDPGFTRARWTWSSKNIDRPHLAISLQTDPEVLGETRIHWGPPAGNERAEDFRARWGERIRLDEGSDRLYTLVRRPMTDPWSILLNSWNEYARGLFAGSAISPLEGKDLENGLRKALSTDLGPWESHPTPGAGQH